MQKNIPVKLLRLLEDMISLCFSCVKWGRDPINLFLGHVWCSSGLCFSTFLFAIYLDDLSEICTTNCVQFIILYADDILLMTYSVVDLGKLIRLCQPELNWLDNI